MLLSLLRSVKGAHWREGIPQGTRRAPGEETHLVCSVSSLRTEARRMPPPSWHCLLRNLRGLWVLTVKSIHPNPPRASPVEGRSFGHLQRKGHDAVLRFDLKSGCTRDPAKTSGCEGSQGQAEVLQGLTCFLPTLLLAASVLYHPG